MEKDGNVIMYVDFDKKIPCHEEIRNRFNKYEESFREEQTPEALHLADAIAMYRKTGRLVLNWGWFLEKVLADSDKVQSEEFVKAADSIVVKLVNEIYSEKIEQIRDELECGCRQMMEMLNCKSGGLIWYSLEKLHSDYPIFEEMLLDFREFGKVRGLAEKQKNWSFLKNWVERHKGDPECAEDINRIWCAIIKSALTIGVNDKLSFHLFDQEFVCEQLAEVEAFAAKNDGWGSLYVKCVLIAYCGIGDHLEKDSQKEAAVRARIREKLRMLAQKGENLFTAFFQSGYVPRKKVECLSELWGLYEKGEHGLKVDLKDIDGWVKHSDLVVTLHRNKNGISSSSGRILKYRDELLNALLWIARHLEVTDDLGESDALIQNYLFSMTSEEELCFFYRKGFFPKRNMGEVIKFARRGEANGKMPLLIQRLHE